MFYQKKTCSKKLLQSKDLNIYHKVKKLNAQTCTAEKQYQKLDKVFKSNKKEGKN